MRTFTPKASRQKGKTPPRPPRNTQPTHLGDGNGSGFCPICGETNIPRGPKLARHLEQHDLTLSDIDETGVDEFQDALDRLEPGVPQYAAVVRRAYKQAKQVNELYRMLGKPDSRKETKPIKRPVRWDAKLGRLVLTSK
jgi:hypothetical protein